MLTQLTILGRDPKFLAGVYNYCDRWCEHCPVTDRCLVFAAERLRRPAIRAGETAVSEAESLLQEVADDIARAQASMAGGAPADTVDAGAAALPPEVEAAAIPALPDDSEPKALHPLEFLARHYAAQAGGFLRSLPALPSPSRPPSSLEVIGWFHVLVAVKTRRSLESHRKTRTESPEMLADALGSAKIALIGIDRSLAAWQQVAAGDEDARIAALIEMLEALRTGLEIRFPDARAFRRPGLD